MRFMLPGRRVHAVVRWRLWIAFLLLRYFPHLSFYFLFYRVVALAFPERLLANDPVLSQKLTRICIQGLIMSVLHLLGEDQNIFSLCIFHVRTDYVSRVIFQLKDTAAF